MGEVNPAYVETKHIVRLAGITALIIVGVVALFFQHVLGSLRRRTSDKFLHAVVLGSYTLSYALVSYTLGLMQSSEYYYHEFPVWAVCLLMLLGGTDSLTACALDEVDNWKGLYVKHLLKGVLVVYIVTVYGPASGYQAPLWAILFINVLQSYARITSMRMASKSHLLWKIVKPIDDHMKHEVQKASGGQERNPKTMEGYRFIVTGERREKKHAKQLERVSSGNDGEAPDKKITTVEEIWQCDEPLLRSKRGMRLKDVCLSMALSKMLNRRFAGFKLPEEELKITREFVFGGLLAGKNKAERAERAFRVIEVELGFVHDLYYTRYPYLYHKGRYFALYLPVAMVTLCSWLTYKLSKKLKENPYLSLKTTLYLMVVVTFLEVFQLYLHMASGWFKVALIRSYVTRHALQRGGCFSRTITGILLSLKALRPWEAKLGQYSLLQYFDDTRRASSCLHYATLCLVDKAKKGRKRRKLVKLSEQVKQAVLDSLVSSEGQLTNGVRSLQKNGVDKLLWACHARNGMVTHTILIWHIATTLCKHQLETQAKDKRSSALSEEDRTAIDTASSVASSLSEYCAYLVAFAPNLLPDGSFASFILSKSIEEARDLEVLKGAKTMESKCQKLMGINDEAHAGDDHDTSLIKLGVRLAKQLSDNIQERKRWADFWAETVLYVAPCDDAQAREHLEALARGGEFITHLWALLTHAGVLKQDPPEPQPVV